MRFVLKAALVVAPLLFGFQTATAAVQCLNCNDAQLLAKARTLGPGTNIVWNPANGLVKKFSSYCGNPNGVDPVLSKTGTPAPTAGCTPLTTDEVAVSQDIVGVAKALSQIYVLNGGSFTPR